MITLLNGDLYQWDTGRIVKVEPDNDYDIHEVHFTTSAISIAYVVNTYAEDGITYCAIPNVLLQQYQSIVCYEVRKNEQGEETVASATLKINKRNKPEDYIYTESELSSYQKLQARIQILEDKINQAWAAKVTDDHINELIDTKLGVIENGSY